MREKLSPRKRFIILTNKSKEIMENNNQCENVSGSGLVCEGRGVYLSSPEKSENKRNPKQDTRNPPLPAAPRPTPTARETLPRGLEFVQSDGINGTILEAVKVIRLSLLPLESKGQRCAALCSHAAKGRTWLIWRRVAKLAEGGQGGGLSLVLGGVQR